MKYSVIIIVIILTVVILFYFAFPGNEKEANKNPYGELKILRVKVKNDFFFIKTAFGGITSDKEIIIISKDSTQAINIDEDMVFEGVRNNYLYYIKNDRLNVILDIKRTNKSVKLENIVKIDSSANTNIYYYLFNKGLKLNDSISIFRF